VFQANATSERARAAQHVLIAPTKHCNFSKARGDYTLADRYLGDARLDYPGLYLTWFDAWLHGEGVGPGPDVLPKVTYFHLGRNEWRTADTWPVPGAVETAFHLHSGGRANSRLGDGVLSTDAAADEPCDRFTYDPADPVPSRGGGAGGPHTLVGPRDQSDIELRPDVLCYSTDPLPAPLDVTGPVRAVLFVSSDVRDTDLTAKLVDVRPDGTAIDLCEAFLRLRYRDGYAEPRLLEPGTVYEVHLDLQATSTVFEVGHRVRLDVTGSSFPRFDRNLNTGGANYDETAWVVATTTVHHTAATPSRLMLWVVPPPA
jgi:putative CocE/NonD family hydrolase